MARVRKHVTQKKAKQSRAAKTATGVNPEAVSRLVTVIRDLFERRNVQEHEFNAVVMAERLSYGAKRESDREFKSIIDRIRKSFQTPAKKDRSQKHHDIGSSF